MKQGIDEEPFIRIKDTTDSGMMRCYLTMTALLCIPTFSLCLYLKWLFSN